MRSHNDLNGALLDPPPPLFWLDNIFKIPGILSTSCVEAALLQRFYFLHIQHDPKIPLKG
jgi:hypothetical protein